MRHKITLVGSFLSSSFLLLPAQHRYPKSALTSYAAAGTVELGEISAFIKVWRRTHKW
jgi:hypothetical protein